MIAPRVRLLIVTFLLGIPMIGFLFSGTELAMPSGILLGLLGLTVFLDAMIPDMQMSGIEITAQPVFRLTKGKEGTISIRVVNATQKAFMLGLGLPFPRMVHTTDPIQISRIKGGSAEDISWLCTGLSRGVFPLERIYFETHSRLGFWNKRASKNLNCEIRVYPDLSKERKVMAALFLNSQGAGIHSQRLLGQGKEFEKLRNYLPGDSFNDIHWKASAKRSHLVTKEFRTEQTQEIYLVIDAARLSSRAAYAPSSENGDMGETVLERFITAALIMGLAAEKQGDLFGVMAFNESISAFTRAKGGKPHFQACRDALFHLQAEPVSPDFDELCAFIRLKIRKRALLIFLVNLDDPLISENFLKSIELISRHHLVLVGMIQDQRVQPMFSSAQSKNHEDLYYDLGAHLKWQELQKVKKLLLRHGVQLTLFPNEQLCLGLITQYMNIKQRQIL